MNYSTAKWLIGILTIIGFVTVIFDLNKDVPPALISFVRPLVLLTLFPALLLLFGHIIARGKKEEKISGKSLGRSFIIIAALLSYRWMTGYFD